MDLAISTSLHSSFEDAVARTREVLAEQGFGVLTQIRCEGDAEARLAATRHGGYTGSSAPQPAAKLIARRRARRQSGLPLPCNVVVRADR